MLFREGERADRVCVVRSGAVKLKARSGAREVLGPGHVFGAQALDATPSSYEATASVKSESAEIYHCARENAFAVVPSLDLDHTSVQRDIRVYGPEDVDVLDAASNSLRCAPGARVAVKGLAGELFLVPPGNVAADGVPGDAKAAVALAALRGDHPFVASLVGELSLSRAALVAAPALSGLDLFAVAREHLPRGRCGGADATAATYYLAGVAAALEHLKRGTPKVAFRDLAPERVAVALDGRPVLADFGDAKPIESLSHTLCGTPEFVAPEMARGVGHDAAVDSWGLGVLAHDLLAGATPFAAPAPLVVYARVLRARAAPRLAALRPHRTWRNCCRRLLEPDAALRLGALSNGARDIRHHFAFGDVLWPRLLALEEPAPFLPPSLDAAPRRSVPPPPPGPPPPGPPPPGRPPKSAHVQWAGF